MLRLSPLLLVLAAAVLSGTLLSGTALAQTPPPAPAAEPAAAGVASPAPAATATVAPTQPTAATPPTLNARLTPGGIQASTSTFPLGMQINLSNSVGNGVLAPGYQAQPQWSSVVSLSPNVKLPKFEGLPRMLVGGSLSFSVNNWMNAFSNSGVLERQVRVSDAGVRLILPGLYTEEFTGISSTVLVGLTAPLSIGSRQQNLITSLSAAVPLSWGSPESPVGSFFVQYVPSARLSLYSEVGATMQCDDFQEYGTPRPLGNPVSSTDDLPTFIPSREVQILDNGDCVLPGRQRMASINNGLSGGWSSPGDGAHSVFLSLGYSLSFLRPLSNQPDLKSAFASDQNFNDSTSGSIGYSYTVPVDFFMQLSVSAGSEQAVWLNDNGNQVLAFPFWDFYFPANNSSGVSFDVTVGI